MSGETDLSVLIRSMEPVLSANRYGYVSLAKGQPVPAGCATAVAAVRARLRSAVRISG